MCLSHPECFSITHTAHTQRDATQPTRKRSLNVPLKLSECSVLPKNKYKNVAGCFKSKCFHNLMGMLDKHSYNVMLGVTSKTKKQPDTNMCCCWTVYPLANERDSTSYQQVLFNKSSFIPVSIANFACDYTDPNNDLAFFSPGFGVEFDVNQYTVFVIVQICVFP